MQDKNAMKTLVSNLFTKGFSVKAVLYRTNQSRSRMGINLHSFDFKHPKCWVIGSWGTTILTLFLDSLNNFADKHLYHRHVKVIQSVQKETQTLHNI